MASVQENNSWTPRGGHYRQQSTAVAVPLLAKYKQNVTLLKNITDFLLINEHFMTFRCTKIFEDVRHCPPPILNFCALLIFTLLVEVMCKELAPKAFLFKFFLLRSHKRV